MRNENKIVDWSIPIQTQGFIAFTSLLIVSAVILGASVSIVILGVSNVNSSLGYKKGQETLRIAHACTEEALLRLRGNADYSGGTLNVADGSCTISISSSGNARTIDVGATITGPPRYVKKIRVTAVRLGNSVAVTNWDEAI